VAAGAYAALASQLTPGTQVQEMRDKLIVPGFIDTHIHYPQTDMIASPAPGLLPWLNTYTFPTERKFEDPDHARETASFFMDELLANGTTTALVYCTVHKQSVDAFFSESESRNLRIVLTKTEAEANAAKAAIEKGQSWAAVAKKYSIDPSKSKGGALTGVTAGQQDSTLSKAAFAAPVNKLIGPVKSQFGYYLIEVTKITPATQKTLAQSTALIKQTLQSQLTTAAQTAVDNTAKKNWLKKTECLKLYAMADCNGYKAPKTSSSSAAAGAATSGAGAATAPAATGTGTAAGGTSAPAATGTSTAAP